MKRVLAFAAILSSSMLLAGCPIYPSDACDDSSDCPGGYVCDNYSNQCVVAPSAAGGASGASGSSAGTSSSYYCASPADCAPNETCGEDGACFPGDCSVWGCVTGYTCDLSTGYAVCVSNGGEGGTGGVAGTGGTGGTGGSGGVGGTGGSGAVAGSGGAAGDGGSGGNAGDIGTGGSGGAAGDGGTGGTGAIAGSGGTGGTGAGGTGGTGAGAAGTGGTSTAGTSGTGGTGGTGGVAGTSGAAGTSAGSSGAAGSSSSTCGSDGLGSATGLFQLVDGSTTSACLGGLDSIPGSEMIVAGVSDSINWRFSLYNATSSSGTITCNQDGVICSFQFQQTAGQTTTTYNATGSYNIQVGGWDAVSFVGTVNGMSALKTTSVPGGSQNTVVNNLLLVINGSKTAPLVGSIGDRDRGGV